jgi:ABC-type phosphate/phosphonate transport system substrate-binding protein
MPSGMIANARMYSVNAATADAWRMLLEWVAARAGIACEVVDWPPPQPLSALWARADLAAAFMCGYPFALAAQRPTLLAAPVPAMQRCEGEPVYWTDIVVRADSPLRTLAGLFGRRFAYTAPDSQSGYQAPRRFLAPHAAARGGRLFAAAVGPLVTPRRVVDAVIGGECDAGPLDSYWHELLRASEPETAAELRVIAATDPTPIPALVAAATIGASDAARLTDTLLAVERAPELAPLRAQLRLQRFAAVPPERYDVLLTRAHAADELGYPQLA